jgi:hypothetical protein
VRAIDSSADEIARKAKQEAVDVIDARIKPLKRISTLLERVETQIEGVGNAMVGWLTAIVCRQALPPKQAASQVAPLVVRIRAEREQLKDFDKELAQMP